MAATNNTRQPAELEMIGGKGKRQRCWEAIRARREHFTMLDVACAADADTETTQTYLQALLAGGYIVQTNQTRRGQQKHFRLERDNGLEAPRLTKDGKPVTQGLAQEQMWRTLRIIGNDFTYLELAGLASTSEIAVATTAARDYLKHLARAGYVTAVEKGKGRGGSGGGIPTRYRFNRGRYTGPRPPMVQRTKSVYDPNLGCVVWQEEADHDDL